MDSCQLLSSSSKIENQLFFVDPIYAIQPEDLQISIVINEPPKYQWKKVPHKTESSHEIEKELGYPRSKIWFGFDAGCFPRSRFEKMFLKTYSKRKPNVIKKFLLFKNSYSKLPNRMTLKEFRKVAMDSFPVVDNDDDKTKIKLKKWRSWANSVEIEDKITEFKAFLELDILSLFKVTSHKFPRFGFCCPSSNCNFKSSLRMNFNEHCSFCEKSKEALCDFPFDLVWQGCHPNVSENLMIFYSHFERLILSTMGLSEVFNGFWLYLIQSKKGGHSLPLVSDFHFYEVQ